MKSNVRWSCLLVVMLALPLQANDQIAWVNDFSTASGMAAEQRRLVLLHFYNDNCEPCIRLEKNVFNKAEVAQAVAQNYVAVKVHAGKNPQLAARYGVDRWPTDVFVTPVGQQVHRVVSPQKPAEYIAVLQQVAQQTGISSTRSWGSQLAQAVVPVSAQAAVGAEQTTGAFDAASQQASTTVQGAMQQAQERFNGASSQFQQVADQGRQAAQQAATSAQQGLNTANQWGQQALNSAQQYQQQAYSAQQQARDQVSQYGQQVQQQVQQNVNTVQQQVGAAQQQWNSAQQQVGEARQQWAGTAAETSKQLQQAASSFSQTWQQAAANAALDRRSAFIPQGGAEQAGANAVAPQAATAAAAASSASSPASSVTSTAPPLMPASAPMTTPAAPVNAPVAAAAVAPAAPTEAAARSAVPTPTTNPWMAAATRSPQRPAIPATPPATTNAAPAVAQRPQAPVSTPAPAPAQVASSAPAAAQAKMEMIPVSQAPPIALDGFCPVTLLDTLAHDPSGRSAWKKGDKQFGAIHLGRTYLFTSIEQQQKFLANPDGYAPVLSGCDPVRFAERGEYVDGKRAYGLITQDRKIYLFADETSRDRFEKSPASFSTALQQAMQRNVGGNVYR